MKRFLMAFLFLPLASCAGPRAPKGVVFPAGTAVQFGLPSGAVPSDDLITGGEPNGFTIVGAAKAGVRSVVNLQTERESPHPGLVRQWAKKSGLEFFHLPIDGTAGVTRENADRLDAVLRRAPRPVLVHCASSNRVGALLALRAFYVDGLSAEEAVAYGKRAGLTRLEKHVRRLLVQGALK
ncbi:MAG: hypothetical protein AUJ52_15540 [Elusimicrobia bacterium CG1_02_63_36]|nr:MAG: hypothetical protein AUJ52_15540 [Elusimicrobia bacterium CG1_02_63_36]PIP84548.1 MAG: hypothetical protein COR54_03665 [Elusimicrobia bacterium CG22_combo_CG10-13_8_21_14_all_63_91]PJA14583.1 MAG: hypothetical protein COX66_12145 [Elusimicrobia bacterium CG_4_10_14_0_2_um_filter_63_34]PJB26835.1 MAG: hypothetical protein CO113_01475 [Elusimicrobia bacterium CG_4_9_14_3_um_filter_62_55]